MIIAILVLSFAVVCLIAAVLGLKCRADRERREKHAHEQAHAQAHADHQVTRQRVDALYEHFKLQPVVTTPEAPKMVCITKM